MMEAKRAQHGEGDEDEEEYGDEGEGQEEMYELDEE